MGMASATANLAFAHPEFPEGCIWTGELFKGFISDRERDWDD
jgi:hypothetical protein